MVQGNSASGEYFLDCGFASQSVLRAIFGAWITICIAIISVSLRSVYGSIIKSQLFNRKTDTKPVSLWSISPPSSPFEVFELWRVLTRSLRRRQFFYFTISFVSVLSAIISALSTTIANHTIVKQNRYRISQVPGRLATEEVGFLGEPVATIAWTVPRIEALDRASAPLDELFDFVPDDASGWVYVGEEWNNTWKGGCTYSLHKAVDLQIKTTLNTSFQDEVPLLGALLPPWATFDRRTQAVDYSSWRVSNSSGAVYQDVLVIYAFASAYGDSEREAKLLNVSFANIVFHNVVPAPPSTGRFVETAVTSDVHVADCAFVNSLPGTDYQAYPAGSNPNDIAVNVASVFKKSFLEDIKADRSVQQPTARQMVRAGQAYLTVKDTIRAISVQRPITVYRPVTQIRLSAVGATVGACLLAVAAAIVLRCIEPRDHGKRLKLPSSQFDWTVQAASEHYQRNGGYFATSSPVSFAMQHTELVFLLTRTNDGLVPCVASPTEGFAFHSR